MSKILLPAQDISDWKGLLADPEKQWKPGYSAMATARSWMSADGLPPEISALFESDPELIFAVPEHKVPLPGGRRDSQCDVFALLRAQDQTVALAVEAKVNEPFDRTLGDWLADGSEGKKQRLQAICDYLECPEPPADLRYQLFHRSAAAIIESKRLKTDAAAMVVQSFSQEHRWFDDFAAFCAFLGTESERGVLHKRLLSDGRSLMLAWVTGAERHLDTP